MIITLFSTVPFILLSLLIIVMIWIMVKQKYASEELVNQIHKLINDIVKQTSLLRQNINILDNNVTLLGEEVDRLKQRNTILSEQIVEVRTAIKLKLEE